MCRVLTDHPIWRSVPDVIVSTGKIAHQFFGLPDQTVNAGINRFVANPNQMIVEPQSTGDFLWRQSVVSAQIGNLRIFEVISFGLAIDIRAKSADLDCNLAHWQFPIQHVYGYTFLTQIQFCVLRFRAPYFSAR